MLSIKSMPERIYYLDNCKAALIVLVVMHHVALTYAATSGWYYYEPSTDRVSVGILNFYMATNRAYILAIFFFIAAYCLVKKIPGVSKIL